MAYRTVVSIILCVIIWTANVPFIVSALKKRITAEIFIHTGFSLFFSLVIINIIHSLPQLSNVLWLRIVGICLIVPSVYLIIASHRELHARGKPQTHELDTIEFIDTGIYRYMRQPMTLGMALWSASMFFIFQTWFALVVGMLSVFCFWMSARTETAYNIRKFGDAYRTYLKEVPMWNIVRSLRKR